MPRIETATEREPTDPLRAAVAVCVTSWIPTHTGVRSPPAPPCQCPPPIRACTGKQCRLWDTVLPQSALCPARASERPDARGHVADVAALYDLYHPSTCLYATRWDRWSEEEEDPRGGDALSLLHLGFFTSTILSVGGRRPHPPTATAHPEFCVSGLACTRFTFVHILQQMHFGREDINAEVVVLDETFFRRIFTGGGRPPPFFPPRVPSQVSGPAFVLPRREPESEGDPMAGACMGATPGRFPGHSHPPLPASGPDGAGVVLASLHPSVRDTDCDSLVHRHLAEELLRELHDVPAVHLAPIIP